MNNKGSITLSTIILFMALIPGLLMIAIGINNLNSLRKAISATQFAAESIAGEVALYDEETNMAEFNDENTIKNNILSIINGNIGIKDSDDFSDTFVSETPIVNIVLYREVEVNGIDVELNGKPFHFDKPGALISVKYRLKNVLIKNPETPYITVVRQYEINTLDKYYDPPRINSPIIYKAVKAVVKKIFYDKKANIIISWLDKIFGMFA